MAIIYTPINSGTPALDPLVARIYADGVDIHSGRLSSGVFDPPHPLRACTSFQWQFNDRLSGSTWENISGATNDEYQVPENSVANSGDYRCIVTIGEGTDCREITDVRTIAIIDCGDTSAVIFQNAGGNGSRTIAPVFPHFLQNNIIETHPSWINTFNIVCATASDNVCTEVETLTASANPNNFARNGYVDISIGDFLCSYPVQQQFAAAAPDPVPPNEPDPEDPPIGPTLGILNANPDLLTSSSAVVSAFAVIVDADGNTIQPEGGYNHQTSWDVTIDGTPVPFVAGGDVFGFDPTVHARPFYTAFPLNTDGSSISVYLTTNSNPTTHTIEFTLTANNITVVDSTNINVTQTPSVDVNGVVSGETSGTYRGRNPGIPPLGPNDKNERDASHAVFASTFTVEQGTARLQASFDGGGGFAQRYPYTGNALIDFTITGPTVRGGTWTTTLSVPSSDPSTGFIFDPDFVQGDRAFARLTGTGLENMGEKTITSSNTTSPSTRDDGRFEVGTYTVNINVRDVGDRLSNRRWYNTFNPGGSFFIFPYFNFLGA